MRMAFCSISCGLFLLVLAVHPANAGDAPRDPIPIGHVKVNVQIDPSLDGEEMERLSEDPLVSGLKMQFDIVIGKARKGGSRLVVTVNNRTGKDDQLIQLALEVDRKPGYRKVAEAGVLAAGKKKTLIDRPAKPGKHTIGARLIFRGRTGKRRALRVEAVGGIELEVEKGKVVEVEVRAGFGGEE